MGGGRDKRKKAKEKKEGPSVPKGEFKTERATAKNEEKKERRTAKKLEGNEDDIDALLAKFALEEKAKKQITIESDCSPPGARVSASFVAHSTPSVNEIIMFGGEMTELETGKVRVYNDLYRFDVGKQRWSRVCNPSSPAPRSAHQAIIHKGFMYVFGGEFTSPNQERFHHFKELWRLDLSTWEWDHLPGKGGPSARSGHRMALYKGKAILFGGYYDNGRDMRYYNDLWELDLGELKWRPVGAAPGTGALWPSARSGCQLALHGDTLFVYGGYSKSRDEDDPELEHGKVVDDMWALNLTNYTWERVKKVGMAPSPRSSFSMVVHKGRAFLFGGASDNEAKDGLDLCSEFHNDLYTFNLEKRRWFAAELRPSKESIKGSKGAGDSSINSSQPLASQDGSQETPTETANKHEGMSPAVASLLEAGKDPKHPLYKAAAKIQAQFRGHMVRKAYRTYRLGGAVSEILYSPAAYGLDMSSRNMPKPKARIAAQACVVGNVLWLFGGTIEIGDKEVTLDDIWSLDLNKLDGWNLVKENTVGEDAFNKDAGSSEWETDGGSEDEDGSEAGN
mmetsp:Transcript_4365/g.11848  ORF Transcript_4365/g.11848 Transcript_4365/m.11848 type:complete len:564 (-) Transcript_4365:268-1959(-)|eukprot:CAMPEP_0202351726 /NCGR_PEP_ID=MMETSP1126-20121109/8238_1 /ASSEMBLY_ACC=CAM_ASM_000457 /TAXON_ID=3047 /ORGANISM="Dunaliella tertiolecta, Strain CCMP1320" /LENGTH=563 /DNA_ID=CAMNT_0048943865 /DNA_START=44 /DNA_END=1735 /DNA_ORIENTATION=-